MIKSDGDHKSELQVALENKEKETVERVKEAVEKTLREGIYWKMLTLFINNLL